MGLSKITIVKGTGGIGRLPTAKDHISGLLFWDATLPTGYGTDNVKKVFSTEEAETLGITVALFAEFHYHIKGYFDANPLGELWVAIYPLAAGAYDFVELITMNAVTGGEVRNLGVYNAHDEPFLAADCTTLQAIIAALPGSANEMQAYYHGDMSAIASAAAEDLRALICPNVAVIAGEDGGAVGAALAVSTTNSISALGAYLGEVSKAPVNESAAYVKNHNFSDGTELETLALAFSAELVADTTEAALSSLKDKGYSFLRKHTPEIAGSYSERMPACVVATDDFAWIEVGRTVSKAVRQVRTGLTPELNRPLLLNSDGTLTDEMVDYFEALSEKQVKNMLASDEISFAEAKIDPTQDVLATSLLVISLEIVPTATAESITVNIQLVAAIT